MTLSVEHPTHGRFRDLTGQRFGKWVVLSFAGRTKRGLYAWWCRCECGTERMVGGHYLKRGLSEACGCVARAKLIARCTTHGQSHSNKTPTYTSWATMRIRCNNPNAFGYENYGGRGITVCERWNDFTVFLNDMGERPSMSHSIDRIDNSKGYYPENCRWATRREQSNNRRSNRKIEFYGVKKTISEWARMWGMGKHTIKDRLNRGVPEAEIFITPDPLSGRFQKGHARIHRLRREAKQQ